MSFKHGISINETDTTPSSVVSIPSAVIALIGTAPAGPIETLTKVENATDAAQFGPEVPGFSIPKALSAIFAQGPAQVLVVNVADADLGSESARDSVVNESHVLTTTVQMTYAPSNTIVVMDATATITYVATTDYTVSPQGVITRVGSGSIGSGDTILVTYEHLEAQTVTNMKATLNSPPYHSAVVNVRNFDYATTYVEGTDYEIDLYGNLTAIFGGAIVEGQEITIQYDSFDGALAADIIGAASPRAGLYLYEEAFTTYGYDPSIFIAPDYTTVTGVYEALRTTANSYQGVTILDATAGLTVAQVETDRGAAASGNFNVSDNRVFLAYPQVNVYDSNSDALELRPSSPFWAGLIAKVDRTESFSVSPSNHAFLGFNSLERTLSWSPAGTGTDTTKLNAVGVLTIRSGSIAWGNRSSGYPNSTNSKTFMVVRRTADVINKSIQLNFVQFQDRPINAALRDSMLQVANAYIGERIGKGDLLAGKLSYDPAKNPAASLAFGQLTFDLTMTIATPAENITINSTIDLEGFAVLG